MKPHGWAFFAGLIIGVLFVDHKAKRAGFAFERKQGSLLSYLARFRPA